MMSSRHATLILVSALVSLPAACQGEEPPPKPRTRDAAESKSDNLARYRLEGFGANAGATLGIKVKFPRTANSSGVTIASFATDSPAQDAGIEQYDWVLEIDDAPVGLIRGRYYQLWRHYGRSGTNKVELLVSYMKDQRRRYYYKKVDLMGIEEDICCVPYRFDAFTSTRPRERSDAETRRKNIARYVVDRRNFDSYASLELGAEVVYSYNQGARITSIRPGSPADRAGLMVGDMILESCGSPVGVFGDRTYEVWRQYEHDLDGIVEFLICFRDSTTNRLRYYYPEIHLRSLATPN